MSDLRKPKVDPDSLEIKVGMGDPRSRYFGQLLSEEDERRLGTDDEPVAEGLLWSQAHTGIYLTVGVGARNTDFDWDIPASVHKASLGNKGHTMVIFTSVGRPTVTKGAFAGASLELPSDLGQDPVKRQYIVEWITHTMYEALDMTGFGAPKGPEASEKFALWVSLSCEHAIRQTGL